MPKTLLGRNKIPHEGVAKLIWGELGARGYSATDLAAIIGASPNTARRRMTNPGSFTLDELLSITRKLDIPLDKLRAEITYG